MPRFDPVFEYDTGPELKDLLDDKKLTERRKAADERFKGLSDAQIEGLRRRCKHDLFFLCAGPLEYDLLSPRLHGNLAGWIQRTEGWQNRMFLLPRDHYKSTIITIGDGVRMALPVEAQTHPYSLGPNVKILIGHEVRETAAKFLYEITAAFTRKELLMFLFPECIPSRREHRVNKWELELPRQEHHKEATFSTIGAGGSAQGGHYHWLKLDDLVGEEARDSETVMKRILQWFDNVNSLLTRLILDGWDLVGTRWAYSDVYSHAIERYGIHVEDSVLNCIPDRDIEKYPDGLLKIYGRGAIEAGVPIFPEEFPLDKLNVLRKNRLVWAAQYANNPLESGLNEFVWPLKSYNVTTNNDLVVFTGQTSKRIRLRELDIVILCDPSMGETAKADESGIIVTGVDDKFNVYILETIKKRLRPPEFVDQLIRLNMKYRPRAVAIEEVNFSAIFKYWLQEKARTLSIHLPIRTYKPGSKRSKDARIRGVAHLFAAGQVYIAESMHDFRDEYDQFPMTKSKHLLDAFSQGPEFWQRGVSQEDIDHVEEAVEQIQDRSALTGY